MSSLHGSPTAGWLDDLVFVPSPLASVRAAQAPSTAVELRICGTQRSLKLNSPWLIRNPLHQQAGAMWPPLCGLLRAAGLALFCPAQYFDKVAAAHVPVRFAKRSLAEPLRAEELRTADAIELHCFHTTSRRWMWPDDLEALDRLRFFVEALRQAVGRTTPIGLGVPIGITTEDLAAVAQAEPDFLTLDGSTSAATQHPALILDTLRRCRELNHQRGAERRLPILLVADVVDSQHIAKLLALGASAVSIDRLVERQLANLRPADNDFTGGMLSGISLPSPTKIDLTPVERELARLRAQLLDVLNLLNVDQVAQLAPHHLRGLTAQTSQLAGVSPLIPTPVRL